MNACKIRIVRAFTKLETEVVSGPILAELEERDIITGSIELHTITPEGLRLYKTKGIELAYENLLQNLFILSSDLAAHFGMRHDNFVVRNIFKLQQRNILPEHLLNFEEMFSMGNSGKSMRTVYALTRQEAEMVILDLTGPKAAEKKFAIVKRLHTIEAEVLQGFFAQARANARVWEGVDLLRKMGLQCSVEDRLATKKDILRFLQIPASTLDSFLRRNRDQITPIRLTREQITAANLVGKRLNAYELAEVLKMVFWMDCQKSIELKKTIFDDYGIHFRPGVKREAQWRESFLKVFDGYGLQCNHRIGRYIVDYFISQLGLAIECDCDDHRSYDSKAERAREKAITEHYALIRFNPLIEWEILVNAVLQIRPKQVVRLYLSTKKLAP